MLFIKFVTFSLIVVRLILDWLNLPELRDHELERIAREYDRSKPWTENDEYEKRTMPREFSKPSAPVISTYPNLLTSQIAHLEKKQNVAPSHQYSTPCVTQAPVLDEKLSPIEKLKSCTRISSQVLAPVDQNTPSEEEEEMPAKRRKVEEKVTVEVEPVKNQICLSTIDDIQDDDLVF